MFVVTHRAMSWVHAAATISEQGLLGSTIAREAPLRGGCREFCASDSRAGELGRHFRSRCELGSGNTRSMDTLRTICFAAPGRLSFLSMKRQLIAIIVMLAIALQGSVVAFAASSPAMSTHCQIAGVSHAATSQESCCPKGQHAMSCCLAACVGTVAGAVTTAPQALKQLRSVTLIPQLRSTRFSSRGDSPLIRPPIL